MEVWKNSRKFGSNAIEVTMGEKESQVRFVDEARRKYINGKLSRATFTSILRAAGQEPARLSLKSILTLGGFFLLIVAGYVCLVVLYA